MDAWPELPAIVTHSGAGVMKLPAWRRDMSEESLLRKDPPFDLLVSALQRQEVGMVCSFAEVPSVLTPATPRQLGLGAGPAGCGPDDLAAGTCSFIMARYAGRIDLWQIGNDRDPFYANDQRYGKLFARMRWNRPHWFPGGGWRFRGRAV